MTESVDQQFIRFTDLLEKNPQYAPMRHRQAPMWNPEVPAELRGVIAVAHIPTLNWGNPQPDDDVPEGTRLIRIDSNGAFVAAATSGTFAHCALTNTGPLDLMTGQLPAGYYLVDAHQWTLGAPGTPLGRNRPRLTTEGRVWVPHTIYSVLRDLTHGAQSWGAISGHWPGCKVYDSWTADPCRLTEWAGVVRDTRAAAKIGGDAAMAERIKVAYSMSVQMWNTPHDAKGTPADKRKKKNKSYRPDWYAALHGQHFANMWRRAYTATVLGHAPLYIGAKDSMIFEEWRLLALLGRANAPRPIRLDETGLSLGTYKRDGNPWYAGIEL